MLQNFGHIPQLSVVSIIDILVVAIIIYEFLKLIKGTRAIPMLAAVILLVGAFWLAHVEQLKTVDWLITTLFPYAVFALIVVFGAEIRHAWRVWDAACRPVAAGSSVEPTATKTSCWQPTIFRRPLPVR